MGRRPDRNSGKVEPDRIGRMGARRREPSIRAQARPAAARVPWTRGERWGNVLPGRL
jgi:hypothetical protein